MAPEQESSDAYKGLQDRISRISYIRDAGGIASWDQQVMMPEGGAPARSKQLSAVSGITHELLVDPEVGEWLTACEAMDLTAEQAAVVREIRRDYDRAKSVPQDLVETLSERSSDAQQIWQDAKADSDFEAFAPILDELKELRIERATHIDPAAAPYTTMYEDRLPTLPLSTVERIFDELKAGLIPLIEEVQATETDLARPFADTSFSEDEQAALYEATTEFLGFPWEHGRLDTSPHPFTAGNQFDTRITTRYKEQDPLAGLMATIHEFGHATYQLGLPKEEYGNPLGSSRGEVHESQSRFWENHVGRTKPFWEVFLPTFKEHLSGVEDLTVDEVYQAANRIYPENTIRVEADEVTYHLHIILRHEIEQEYVSGELDVAEIPSRWNALMDEYLGVVPDDVADGPLQDIQWTGGFGGFPSYTVGSVLAAQLTEAMRADVDVVGCIEDQEFGVLWEWMTEHLHRYGQRYEAAELIEVATGEPLSAEYFLEYVEAKFSDLYDL